MVATFVEASRISHFFSHRDRIEQEIARSILTLGEKTKLRDACEYALKSGGKTVPSPSCPFTISTSEATAPPQ